MARTPIEATDQNPLRRPRESSNMVVPLLLGVVPGDELDATPGRFACVPHGLLPMLTLRYHAIDNNCEAGTRGVLGCGRWSVSGTKQITLT